METTSNLTLTCPSCGSSYRQIKSGKTGAGKQRYHCQDCKRFYVLNPTPRGLDPALRRLAVRMYLDGCGFRRIARQIGVNHQTVVNWIRAEERAQPPAPQPQQSEVIEMDELYALHEKKGTSSSLQPQ